MKPATPHPTEQEAAEIAAECIAAIDWGTEHFIEAMTTDDLGALEIIEAMRPKRPATLQLIEAMKHGAPYCGMKSFVPPGFAPRIVLMPTTCRSIALNLREWGFASDANSIWEALDRSDRAATAH